MTGVWTACEPPGRESSMSSTRQRSDRPDSARRRQVPTPELLESRQLLSTRVPGYLSPVHSQRPVRHQSDHQPADSVRHRGSLMQPNNPNSPLLSNQGKIVSGKDRAGNEWTITVHGPGQVIVTDTTPNDGCLDDDIATIQIIGSKPRIDLCDGHGLASNRVLTNGTVKFNRLIALTGSSRSS